MAIPARHLLKINHSDLFRGFDPHEIPMLLDNPGIRVINRSAHDYIFMRGELPVSLFILLSGKISVERVDINGKRSVMSVFSEPGMVFAEVYLFLDDQAYDYDCRCLTDVEALTMPRVLFDPENKHPFTQQLINNMLSILSQKAFYLNRKVLVLGSYTLRQKIASYLLQQAGPDAQVQLALKREDLADYLGTARPSLSRELKAMQADGLICIDRDAITLCNIQGLQKLT